MKNQKMTIIAVVAGCVAVFAVLLLVLFLTGVITTGGNTAEASESESVLSNDTTEPAETTEAVKETEEKHAPVFYEDYIASFTELAELAGYKLTPLPDVVLDDGDISHTVIASIESLDGSYHAHTRCSADGEVQSVDITTERGFYVDQFYAVLCYYSYLSLNLPDRDADEFYDTFDLSVSDSGEVFKYETTEGWDIYSYTLEEFRVFDIRRINEDG